MILKNISDAKPELPPEIEAVRKGEEVSTGKRAKPRVAGALADKIHLHDCFDAPLPIEIAEAFGILAPAIPAEAAN